MEWLSIKGRALCKVETKHMAGGNYDQEKALLFAHQPVTVLSADLRDDALHHP